MPKAASGTDAEVSILVIAGGGCAGQTGRSVRDIQVRASSSSKFYTHTHTSRTPSLTRLTAQDPSVRYCFVPTQAGLGCTDLPAGLQWYSGGEALEDRNGRPAFSPDNAEQAYAGRELARLAGLPSDSSGLIINGRVRSYSKKLHERTLKILL